MFDFLGREIDQALFRPFEPEEVLFDLDGPRIFAFKNGETDQFLAYQFDEGPGYLRYLVVPTSDLLLRRLKRGDDTVGNALEQPRMWMVELDETGAIVAAYRAEIEKLPNDWLPDPDAMLWPSLQPIISVRSIGDRIREGVTPGSVVRNLIDGAEKAVKVLLEYSIKGEPQTGRPVAELRRLYDLPPQRFAFRSFEVSFRSPDESEQAFLGDFQGNYTQTQADIYNRVGVLLQRGLEWACNPDRSISTVSDNAEESHAILKALSSLAPSAYGLVESVEIKGRLAGRFSSSKPAILDQSLRSDIKKFEAKARRTFSGPAPDEMQMVELVGKIRVADKDGYSFDLRYIQGPKSPSDTITFVHDEDLADDAYYAWNSGHDVRVIGIREGNDEPFRAILIRKVAPGSPDTIISNRPNKS